MIGIKKILMVAAGVSLMTGLPAMAQSVVTETADGKLMMTDYRGKPPFKRQVVSSDQSAEFARFEELADSERVVTATVWRSGPPGKSLASQRLRISRVPAEQITEFARFEESSEPASSARMWRGAPGKGRPLLNR